MTPQPSKSSGKPVGTPLDEAVRQAAIQMHVDPEKAAQQVAAWRRVFEAVFR